MSAAKVVSYVAVFAAGALALAGFTAVTDNPEPPTGAASFCGELRAGLSADSQQL